LEDVKTLKAANAAHSTEQLKTLDRNDYLKPVTNQTYEETCGDCHFGYQPELLPSASWLKIVLFSCVFPSEFINQRLSF
jgi:hypothetical protein